MFDYQLRKKEMLESIVNEISLLDKDRKFYYKQLPTGSKEKVTVCPVCGKEISCHIWQHILANIDNSKHYDFAKEQLEMCHELYFNQWYTGDQDIKGFYMSYKGAKEYWGKWFGEKTFRKRGRNINWDFIKEHSYYDENFSFEKDLKVCPICNKNCDGKRGTNPVLIHICNEWRDEAHQQILFLIIGEILHREKWDKNCWYSFDNFYYLTKTLKGKSYVASHSLKEHIATDQKVDFDRIKKEYYYDGDIHFKEIDNNVICPVCNEMFAKKAITNHVMKSWKDSSHYDFILRFVGNIMHGNRYLEENFLSSSLANELKEIGYASFHDKRLQEQKLMLERSQCIIDSYEYKEFDFFYKELECNDKNKVCPICKKKIASNASVFKHAMRAGHFDFIEKQIKMCNELFFNLFYGKGMNIEDYYVDLGTEVKLWNQWFGKEKVLTRCKAKNCNWQEIAERSYYNENLWLDYVCPACGKNCLEDTYTLIFHIFKQWRDPKHYDLVLQIVGDMLHKTFWDETCCYDFNTYRNVIKTIKGKEFWNELSAKNRKLRGRGCRSGFRTDIGFYVNSAWEANVYRIFKYELGDKWDWIRGRDCEIPFDISDKNHKQTYYVDIYDKYGVFEKDAYIEIKGVYDEDAKYKKEMFKKLYPDKKYLTIGNPYDDFYPDIVYDKLCEKYQNVIPNWELKSSNNELIEKRGAEGVRKDLMINARNFREANLFRILKCEYGESWQEKVSIEKFDLSYDKKHVEGSFVKDNGEMFNCYLAIEEEFTADDRFKIARFRELHPDKKLLVIGDKSFDVSYKKLESKYSKMIDLWETEENNLSNHVRKFKFVDRKHKVLKQTLGKRYVLSKIKLLDRKFGDKASPSRFKLKDNKCPSCGKNLEKCCCWQHALANYDTHKEMLDDQCRLISELFWDTSFCSKDSETYGLCVSEYTCKNYWKELFPKELYIKRKKLLI